jgi:2-iminoacetate synthase
LFPLGITLISAGSHTEPGGYTGAGSDKLHVTERGRTLEVPVIPSEGEHGMGLRSRRHEEAEDSGKSARSARLLTSAATKATEQFAIADERSAAKVAEKLHALGYEAVWKDWDPALTEAAAI